VSVACVTTMQKKKSKALARVSSGPRAYVVREDVRRALDNLSMAFVVEAPRVDEAILAKRYSALRAWPADAQLGLMVLALVLGPGFRLAGFAEAVNQLVPDFIAASRAIGHGKTPTAIVLGGIARACFRNAQLVVHHSLDANLLFWPTDLSRTVGSCILTK
jgi:hypothetical protein